MTDELFTNDNILTIMSKHDEIIEMLQNTERLVNDNRECSVETWRRNVKTRINAEKSARELACVINALENLFEVTALAPRLTSEGIGDDELAALRDEAIEEAFVALSNHTAMLTSEAVLAYIGERELPFEGWEEGK